jgi:hypothetical protein
LEFHNADTFSIDRRIKHYKTTKVVWLWFVADKTPFDEYTLHNPGLCRLVEQFFKLCKLICVKLPLVP